MLENGLVLLGEGLQRRSREALAVLAAFVVAERHGDLELGDALIGRQEAEHLGECAPLLQVQARVLLLCLRGRERERKILCGMNRSVPEALAPISDESEPEIAKGNLTYATAT